MSNKTIDEIDKTILRMLQNDARIQFKEIADKCNVSTDTIKNRFTSLKKKGIIRGTLRVRCPLARSRIWRLRLAPQIQIY